MCGHPYIVHMYLHVYIYIYNNLFHTWAPTKLFMPFMHLFIAIYTTFSSCFNCSAVIYYFYTVATFLSPFASLYALHFNQSMILVSGKSLLVSLCDSLAPLSAMRHRCYSSPFTSLFELTVGSLHRQSLTWSWASKRNELLSPWQQPTSAQLSWIRASFVRILAARCYVHYDAVPFVCAHLRYAHDSAAQPVGLVTFSERLVRMHWNFVTFWLFHLIFASVRNGRPAICLA